MVADRAKKLVAAMGGDFEAALLQTDVSKFYFLDFEAPEAGTLIVLPDRMVYIVDTRYTEAAGNAVKNAEVVVEKHEPGYGVVEQTLDVLRDAGVKRVHVETGITLGLYEKMRAKAGGLSFIADGALTNAIVGMRRIKDEEEVARMRQAQVVTDLCFGHILPFIREGVSETDLMLEMEHFMRQNGAEKVAFDTICVAGPKTSLPHGVPGDYRLRPGDFITMDFGARYKGYCADMTRTVALGEPGEEKRKVYRAVLDAHLAGLYAAKAGQTGAAVDKVARDVLTQAGYGQYFAHSLGHSVGIEVHETPNFSRVCEDVVRPGMMMTVEPGVYLPGQFGCRIEDTVLIEENGCIPLPTSEKELIIL